MIKNSCCDKLVLVDNVENKLYMIFDYINWMERCFDNVPGIQELRPNVCDTFIEKLKNKTVDTQFYEIYKYSMSRAEIPEYTYTSEEQKIEIQNLRDVNNSKAHDLKYSVILFIENIKENFKEIDGKGLGYVGLLTMNGKRLIQYSKFNDFLDVTPELHRLILKKLLIKYISVYPLRIEFANRIKDSYPEPVDLFIALDENHELVTDVCLLTHYLMKDDKNLLSVSSKLILSEKGYTITMNGKEVASFETDFFSEANIIPIKTDPMLPPDIKYTCGEIWLKELRSLIPIALLLLIDENPELRNIHPQRKTDVLNDVVNFIHMIVNEGIPILRWKIAKVLKNILKQPPSDLMIEFVYIICNPPDTVQPKVIGDVLMIKKQRLDFSEDIKRILTYMN